MTYMVLLVALANLTAGLCWMAVLLKREAVQGWRRFQVGLMKERCAIDNAPSYCGRQR